MAYEDSCGRVSDAMAYVQELMLPKLLYPDNVDSCSVEQVMPDHCSLSLFSLSLLVGDFLRVKRQLCVGTGCFTFR